MDLQRLSKAIETVDAKDKLLDQIPDEMTLCNLEVLLMPNGEVICKGKSIGWFKELKKFLSIK